MAKQGYRKAKRILVEIPEDLYKPASKNDVINFVNRCQLLVNGRDAVYGGARIHHRLHFDPLKFDVDGFSKHDRYLRIMEREISQPEGHGSLYCWIDLTTGEVMTGSYKAVAPTNGTRGSVFLEDVQAFMDAYGCRYLR